MLVTNDSNASILQTLEKEGVCLTSVKYLMKDEIMTSSAWEEFAATWGELTNRPIYE